MLMIVFVAALGTITDMLSALRALLTSKKFLTATATLVVAFAAKRGYDLDPEYVIAILGLGGILIHAQGQTDAGKEAAKIAAANDNAPAVAPVAAADATPPPAAASQKGSALTETMVWMAGVALVFSVIIGGISACAWFSKEVQTITKDTVDCTTSKASSAKKEFGPLADRVLMSSITGDGKIDTAPLEAAATGFALDVGGCVLMDALARALSPAPVQPGAPRSSPVEADPASVRAAIADLKAKVAGGRSFKLASGTY